MKADEIIEGMRVTYKRKADRHMVGIVVVPHMTLNHQKGVGVAFKHPFSSYWEPEIVPASRIISLAQAERENEEEEAAKVARRREREQTLKANKDRSEAILSRLSALGIDTSTLRLNVWGQLESRDLESLLEQVLDKVSE